MEGKRPILIISGRSHPSFLPYDTPPRAGGFVAERFMTGLRRQEFFFYSMAGRESKINANFEGHFVKDVLLPAIRKEAVDQSLERCKLYVPFV